ncbi:PREDICTED: uncharacterized protein LOC104748937 [Camelina sativa]|uniref:Uncharacterized protein LOC104748937 n=1 Tax=Camelina sativa TaxID=90675 RepID=A0ABM1R1B4_CAMSA|nr:PREDICTED: uncharacterized protein LOC104748937 [Camelina sativa]
MVEDYISISLGSFQSLRAFGAPSSVVDSSSDSSATPSIVSSTYAYTPLIDGDDLLDLDFGDLPDPPLVVPKFIIPSPDTPITMTWKDTPPALGLGTDLLVDVIPVDETVSAPGAHVPYCFFCGRIGHYLLDCQFYTPYAPSCNIYLICGVRGNYSSTCPTLRVDTPTRAQTPTPPPFHATGPDFVH